jgi:tetratricopeptide (TPR) repeat protein
MQTIKSFLQKTLLIFLTCPISSPAIKIYAKPSLISFYQQELQKNPHSFNTHFNLANEYLSQHDYKKAIEQYQKAIALQSQLPEPYFNLGVAFNAIGNHKKAIESYQRAIECKPDYAKAYLNLGQLLHKKEKLELAAEALSTCVVIDPQLIEAYLCLAAVRCEQNLFDNSIDLYHAALALKPDNTAALLGLANTLNLMNKTEEALSVYYQLLTLTNSSSSVLYNIAYTLKKQGKINESVEYYYQALAKDPHHSDAHLGLALAYLMLGDFDRGLPEYEYRWGRTGKCNRIFPQPEWDGVSCLKGKTILLHAEQGFGDTLQFVRYAYMIKEKGANVILAAQSALVILLSHCCPYIDKVIPLTEMYKIPCDVQAPLMSLPFILKTNLNTILHHTPYLVPDQKLLEHWQHRLKKDKKFKVGLCWQGNLNYHNYFLRVVAAARSIDVTMFAPLAECDNVSFYSLQKVTGTDQLKQLQPNFVVTDFGAEVDKEHGRFMDTAAIIKNLDLVITVDTAIAHLAGALDVPVWVLLPNPADWRWMTDRIDTPWYTTMRLFRQSQAGDWKTMVHEIKKELEKKSKDHTRITAEISYGDLIDKMTILEIKKEQLKDPIKLHNVCTEFNSIKATYDQSVHASDTIQTLIAELKKINLKLWMLEDDIREKERTKKFDVQFIELSRSIYLMNDDRAKVKRTINEILESRLIEEKSYEQYT